MRLLLDTHALLWWLFDSPRLSTTIRERLGDPRQVALVSAASAWEITTKHRLGKLSFAGDVPDRLDHYLKIAGFTELSISFAHAARAGRLDIAHKDPFDRLLIAQAQLEELTVATLDPAIQAEVPTIWH